jgi:acetoin utilization deacetylase AcuC-like enzyme
MALNVPVVWSDTCLLHDPGGEVFVGMRTHGTELPERAIQIRRALQDAAAPFVDAVAHDDAAVIAVHDERLVDFLSGAWDAWQASGLDADPGQDRVVPYVFPLPEVTSGRKALEPAATWARTGMYAYDTMTLIGPGTWPAARAAADVALTAADLAASSGLAYACCRPPGHHVTRSAYGGSCYLNNAAIAAQRLRDGGVQRVAVLDVDAHHGNGTQEIFWERPDVFTGSVHVDPAAGWFPHFLGLADEVGGGEGHGANVNVPLPPGAADDEWLVAVSSLCGAAADHGAEALVVALGVDAAGGDPESPLDVSCAGFRQAGRLLGGLGVPTAVVQEGGYDLAAIGGLVLATLQGIEEGWMVEQRG